MNASLILTAVPWAGCVTCAALAVSGCVRMARAKGGWRDAGLQFGPLVFTSAMIAALTAAAAAGVDAMLGGSLLALIPLAPVAKRVRKTWREAVKGKMTKAGATRLILSLIRDQLREALWNAREDLRDLFGMMHRDKSQEERRPVPVNATPGVPPYQRTVPGVPSIRNDPALGAVPAPSEVAAGLAASGVTVPRTWAAVADEIAEHDPESDEEHVEHMDGEVAGNLLTAEAAMSRAETLGDSAGLDPAYISAQYELADAYADHAAVVAQVCKRYHDIYDDMREAANGRPLPAKRGWFGDGSGSSQGGQAA
jgi:hypothetical protein